MNVERVRERFAEKVDTSAGPSACHPWTRATDRDGYGVLTIDGKQRRANRVTFFLTHGYWPTVARHTCDNPPCCNTTHIVDGSHADNRQDMRDRGRSFEGGRNPNAKLSADDVLAIRTSYESGVTLAQRYGVNPPAIYKIQTRRTWRHV